MPGPRHARPPEPRRSRPAPGQGRHRAAPRGGSPFGPAVFGVAAIAAVGGIGLQVFGLSGSGEAGPAAMQPVRSAVVEPTVDAAVRDAAARATRSQERARLRARERAAHEMKLQAAKERQARLERQACQRADEALVALGLDREQQRNLQIITTTARRMGLPPRAAVIATATAWQETRLRNLSYGLGDSVGLFQQRPSMGWGSVRQLQDPHYAARKFYEKLIEVRGWRAMSIGAAAQAVQRSAYPDRYARWAPNARDGVGGLEAVHAAGATC